MCKNTRPKDLSCDKLKVREQFVASLLEINRLQQEINRTNGQIEKEIDVFNEFSERVKNKINADKRAVSNANRKVKELSDQCAASVETLLALI